MADNVNPASNDSIQNVKNIESKDWFIQDTIETVIAAGVELGVTLTVKGIVITGTLINGKKYFEELSDQIKTVSTVSGDIPEMISNSWKKYTEIYVKPEDAPDDWKPPQAGFIHLRGARHFVPGQPAIPTEGNLWRGKLSSIDGFMLGELG